MNYELAKELKEAGFPQNIGECHNGKRIDLAGDIYQHETGNDDEAYLPTLEELIEACGDYFGQLIKIIDGPGWNVQSRWFTETSVRESRYATGKTPEEAVARLWLALNRKK